jgi:HlyD family secretion protein
VQLKAGDTVKAGAVVAVLWPSAPAMIDARSHRELNERVGGASAAVDQNRANVAREEAALEKARIDLTRLKKLQGEGFLSPSALDQAELAVRVQAKSLEAARFALEGATHDLAQARAALMRAQEGAAVRRPESSWSITSPVDGRVLRVLQATEATQIAAGAPVRIDAGSGRVLPGRVRRVEPAAFTKISALGVEEQRVNVIIDFDGTPASLQGVGDGYRVDVRIVLVARQDVTVVPVAALFRRGEDWAAFVLDGDRVNVKTLKIGGRNAQEAWVEEGLAPGDRVVVYPSDSLRDGSRIQVARGS